MSDSTEENRKLLLEKISDATPSAYMQVIGIVQSIAITYLMYNSYQELKDVGFQIDDRFFLLIVRGLACFQLFVMNWHINVQFGTIIKRAFSLRDSYFSFGFVVPEFILVELTDESANVHWFLGLAVLHFFTASSYIWHFRGKNPSFRKVNLRLVRPLKISGYAANAHWKLICMGVHALMSALLLIWMGENSSTVWVMFLLTILSNLEIVDFTLFHEKRFSRALLGET